jgi:hypothetical protein
LAVGGEAGGDAARAGAAGGDGEDGADRVAQRSRAGAAARRPTPVPLQAPRALTSNVRPAYREVPLAWTQDEEEAGQAVLGETVATETPAARATSLIVTRRPAGAMDSSGSHR